MTEYRTLQKGEIIKKGDEADLCNDGWRDPAKWVAAPKHRIGKPVSDPQFVSHATYRRKVTWISKLWNKLFVPQQTIKD